jgi:tetratricopeptide (TPR) repeat protein
MLLSAIYTENYEVQRLQPLYMKMSQPFAKASRIVYIYNLIQESVMRIKIAIAALSAVGLASTAAAQVFVIGNGFSGECYQKTKSKYASFNDAEKTCTQAIREEAMTRTNRAATFVNRGVLRMRNGRYDQALSDYAEALQIDATLGAAHLNAGAAHIYKKDFGAALAPLNEAIRLNSTDIFAAYYNRAIARENTGDLPGAYADFQKSLELNPGWDLAQNQLKRFSVDDANG